METKARMQKDVPQSDKPCHVSRITMDWEGLGAAVARVPSGTNLSAHRALGIETPAVSFEIFSARTLTTDTVLDCGHSRKCATSNSYTLERTPMFTLFRETEKWRQVGKCDFGEGKMCWKLEDVVFFPMGDERFCCCKFWKSERFSVSGLEKFFDRDVGKFGRFRVLS